MTKIKISIKIFIILVAIFLILSSIAIAKENNSKKSIQLTLEEKIFDFKVKMYMRLLKSPSMTVCVIKNDSVVWSNTYGYSNIYLGKKTTLDTIYTIGSISKSVTGTAMMQIIENESYNVNLDDNVSKWLPFDLKNPYFPNTNITFRMLLAHRSGLYDYLTDLFKVTELTDDPIQWVEEHIAPYGKY